MKTVTLNPEIYDKMLCMCNHNCDFNQWCIDNLGLCDLNPQEEFWLFKVVDDRKAAAFMLRI